MRIRWRKSAHSLDVNMCMCIRTYIYLNTAQIHKEHIHTAFAGCYKVEDSYDPLSCRSFSTKEPPNIGLFCGKWPTKIRDPMSLRHPVFAGIQRMSRHASTYTYIYICIRIYIHVYIHQARQSAWNNILRMSWNASTYTHTYIYVFTYTYICVYPHKNKARKSA